MYEPFYLPYTSGYDVVDYTCKGPIQGYPVLEITDKAQLHYFICRAFCNPDYGIMMRKTNHDGYVRFVCDEIFVTPPSWHLPLIDFFRNLNFEVNPWEKKIPESTLIARQLEAQDAALRLCGKINDVALMDKKVFIGTIEETTGAGISFQAQSRCYSPWIPDKANK